MQNILIVGCGYVGQALARRLMPHHRVWGARRRVDLLTPGVQPIPLDLNTLADDRDARAALQACAWDAVIFCAAAKESQAAAYHRVYVRGTADILACLPATPQLVFASSTSVYGESNGEWVDERTPPRPANFRGTELLLAEALILERGGTVVRFGGIYGPQRHRMLNAVRAGHVQWPEHVQWTNRIHRDDAAGVLHHMLGCAPGVYIGVDREPADQRDVLRFLHTTLGVAASPPPVTGPAQGKRCNSEQLQQSGYTFLFPTYREGYGALAQLHNNDNIMHHTGM